MAQATAPADIKTEGGGSRRLKLVLSYLALILITLVFVAPLLWMLSTSFKTNPETTQWPLSWIPREWSVEGYRGLFNSTSETPVLRWFVNSLIAATAHAVLVLVTAAPAAYALARMHFRGKGPLVAIVMPPPSIPPSSP